jgi:hypothetical protein
MKNKIILLIILTITAISNCDAAEPGTCGYKLLYHKEHQGTVLPSSPWYQLQYTMNPADGTFSGGTLNYAEAVGDSVDTYTMNSWYFDETGWHSVHAAGGTMAGQGPPSGGIEVADPSSAITLDPAGCGDPCEGLRNAKASECGGVTKLDALFVPNIHQDIDPVNAHGCKNLDYQCTECPTGNGVANAGVPIKYTGIQESKLSVLCGGFTHILSYDKSTCSGSCQPVACDNQISALKKSCGLSSAGATPNSDGTSNVWGFSTFDLSSCSGTCPDACASAKSSAKSKCPNGSYTMQPDCSYTCNSCTEAIAACVSKCGSNGILTNTCSNTNSKCVCKDTPNLNIDQGVVNSTNTITNPDGTKVKTDVTKTTDVNGNVTTTTTITNYNSSGDVTGTTTKIKDGDINGSGNGDDETGDDKTPPVEYASNGDGIDLSGWKSLPNLISSKMPTKYTSDILSIVSSFSSAGTPPVFTLTIMDHPFDVDMAIFDPVAVIIRVMIILFFNVAIGLVLIRLWSRWG